MVICPLANSGRLLFKGWSSALSLIRRAFCLLFQDANIVIWMQFLPFFGHLGPFADILGQFANLRPFCGHSSEIWWSFWYNFLSFLATLDAKKNVWKVLHFCSCASSQYVKKKGWSKPWTRTHNKGAWEGLLFATYIWWPPERKSSNLVWILPATFKRNLASLLKPTF